MKRFLSTLTLILFSISCIGGTNLATQKITELANGWNSSNLYISTDKQLTAENCSVDTRIVLEESHPQFDLLSSMLLSAIHAKSDVRLYVDGCGTNNFMRLISVKIKS